MRLKIQWLSTCQAHMIKGLGGPLPAPQNKEKEFEHTRAILVIYQRYQKYL